MKMEQTEGSEISAHKIQTPGNHPKERIQHSQLGECLKSGILNLFRVSTLSGYRLTGAELLPDMRCNETEGYQTMSIIVQKGATICSFIIFSADGSTCFG